MANRANQEASRPFEPEMVLIPASAFLLGVDPAEEPFFEDAESDDEFFESAYTNGWHGPRHALHLPDFYMARTPVTNGQYTAFLQATEHPTPRRWRSRNAPRGKEDVPIVYVSWHDALAYCRWLSGVTGKPYRLPSEAEWEKGASWEAGTLQPPGPEAEAGPPGRKRRYPWGDRWDPERCNTQEGGVDRITPVDAYPQGASPYGLLDMAGNVWEWTLSLWGADWYAPTFAYPYDPGDGREDLGAADAVCRVLRGGSFVYSKAFARCAYRYKNFPQNSSDGIGFRVVLATEPDPDV